MKKKIYKGITKELLEKASKLESTKDFDLNSTEGIFTKWGVKIQYKYDKENETSEVTILKKPFVISYDLIWSKMDEVFEKFINL